MKLYLAGEGSKGSVIGESRTFTIERRAWERGLRHRLLPYTLSPGQMQAFLEFYRQRRKEQR